MCWSGSVPACSRPVPSRYCAKSGSASAWTAKAHPTTGPASVSYTHLVYSSALAIVRPQLQAGKIKLLAMANTVRAPSQPNVPTVAEAGYPALALDGLVGLFGPLGMPLELRERITADIRAVADSTVADRLALTGQIMNIGGPEEFARSIEELSLIHI